MANAFTFKDYLKIEIKYIYIFKLKMPKYNPGDFSWCSWYPPRRPEDTIMYTEAIEALIKYPHTKYSYNDTMEVMRFIASNGWDAVMKALDMERYDTVADPQTAYDNKLVAEDGCCPSCEIQLRRDFLYTQASGESVWGHSWRIASNKDVDWVGNEPPLSTRTPYL